MLARTIDGRHLLRFLKGEEVLGGLREFVRAAAVPGGSLTGLGASDDVTVGFWDTEARIYRNYRHQGLIEITSLTGNIAWNGPEPVVHVHVNAFHETEGAFGGHLVSAIVSATVEVSVDPYSGRVERRLDTGIGLPLLDLPPFGRG